MFGGACVGQQQPSDTIVYNSSGSSSSDSSSSSSPSSSSSDSTVNSMVGKKTNYAKSVGQVNSFVPGPNGDRGKGSVSSSDLKLIGMDDTERLIATTLEPSVIKSHQEWAKNATGGFNMTTKENIPINDYPVGVTNWGYRLPDMRVHRTQNPTQITDAYPDEQPHTFVVQKTIRYVQSDN